MKHGKAKVKRFKNTGRFALKCRISFVIIVKILRKKDKNVRLVQDIGYDCNIIT